MPAGQNTPLVAWLKAQLREAWDRELKFKKILNETYLKHSE